MHGVAGALGDHVAQQRLADQRQVADQVERLVAAAFVGEAQAAGIQHAGAVEADRVVERAPRIRPMLRIWSSSYSNPKVRAGAISAA